MATPSGWNWINEYWKLFGAYGTIFQRLTERAYWYDALLAENQRLNARNNRLQDTNDQLVGRNRRLSDENQALREGAVETRGAVEQEAVEKIQAALVASKGSDT